jgi:multidrug efflux pump subunit AcrA (membrane-fusion protein)
MTAVARIATDRIPDVVVVPVEAIFQQDGAPNVYRLVGSEFIATRVEVKRRGREQAILAAGVEPGDHIATRRPTPEMIRRAN